MATTPSGKRPIAKWLPAVIATTLAPLAGAGGSVLYIWKAPPAAMAESENARLRAELERQAGLIEKQEEIAREAETQIRKLADRVEDAYRMSLICCAPKKGR